MSARPAAGRALPPRGVPDLDPPSPRLGPAPLAWRWAADRSAIEVQSARSGRWSARPAWHGDVLEGLAQGEPYTALLARYVARHPDEARAKWGDHLVRRFLLRLHEQGAVVMDFEPAPALFADRYRPLKLLGRGTFGLAYRCADERADDAVVIVKRPWGYYHPLAFASRSIRREAEIMGALDHPSFPRLREAFEQDGLPHIARDFVDGEDLASEGARAEPAALADAAAMARAIEHLHARGWLLLDGNPRNFMRTATGIVAMDLGTCMPHVGGIAELAGPVGSRHFIPPEVRATFVATRASDVYSLGRALAVLVTGKEPEVGAHGAALAATLPEGKARAIVARLAAEDPRERPQDMREALAALHVG